MVQVATHTKSRKKKAPQITLRGFFLSSMRRNFMKRVKYLAYCLCQEVLGGHLLKDLPKFHMALEPLMRVRGMQPILGMMRR
jgi:hypothetical protein